jgi:hypothetical protein
MQLLEKSLKLEKGAFIIRLSNIFRVCESKGLRGIFVTKKK